MSRMRSNSALERTAHQRTGGFLRSVRQNPSRCMKLLTSNAAI